MLAQLNGYFDLPCCLQNKTKTIDAINQKSKMNSKMESLDGSFYF